MYTIHKYSKTRFAYFMSLVLPVTINICHNILTEAHKCTT